MRTVPEIMLLSISTSHFSTTGLALSGLAILKILVSCLYNLFFHPLRDIPGPPLARISRLWSRIGNFHGRKSERIHEAHVKYGSVVRVSPNEISFSDPTAVQDIYTSNDFGKENTFYVRQGMLVKSLGLLLIQDTSPAASETHFPRKPLV